MPIANVLLIEGRSKEQRHKLMEEMAQTIADNLDVDRAGVRVWITEVTADNYSVGGVPKSQQLD